MFELVMILEAIALALGAVMLGRSAIRDQRRRRRERELDELDLRDLRLQVHNDAPVGMWRFSERPDKAPTP